MQIARELQWRKEREWGRASGHCQGRHVQRRDAPLRSREVCTTALLVSMATNATVWFFRDRI